MFPDRRHQLILRALREDGPATVGTLAERSDASQATIRRDLVQLEDEGLLQPVYGGAAPVDGRTTRSPTSPRSALTRRTRWPPGAPSLVRDGETVLLDIGTTAHRVARQLHGRPSP